MSPRLWSGSAWRCGGGTSAYFAQHGSSAAAARRQAIAWIGQTLMNQATFLAYIDAFAVLALFALLLVPASFLLATLTRHWGGIVLFGSCATERWAWSMRPGRLGGKPCASTLHIRSKQRRKALPY